ncbi:translation initiation factor IF-2 [Mycoplasma iguanae]|uniref:Translation initiation factor IF-2 n=1 Tax=Mycoplasma iguanae TaxID=292461 RepID=A0ABY5R946_9MOLU|nr:translation initiation factor IF-2 [Mycoplasma iguanae]UVD81811.1 translation initiation factor IF-2 [Mycoplasma iguanae]
MAKNKIRKSNVNEIKSKMVSVKTELKDGVFTFSGPMTIMEFSQKINKTAPEIIMYFFQKGKMLNVNHTLSEEDIAELCFEFGYDFKKETEINASNFMDEIEIEDDIKDLTPRPPIITIMGHVDHGKTTLLDKIRKANVASSESGGITQHTGSYQVIHKKKSITFLDTPGHEAFTAMRARGAKVTDIVVLVVAADDGVMPQTIEAISHAKAAKVPIIVFVNKMDKPSRDPEKVKAELSTHDVVTEEWGGDTQFIYGSGQTAEGIKELFDAIHVLSEILELKANKNRHPIGVVIESRLDKGRGALATVIVQNGTLYSRDFIVAGSKYGKIRTMESTSGQKIEAAEPGMPVVITGLNYLPEAGDKFFGFSDEKFAKRIAEEKAFSEKRRNLNEKNAISFEEGTKVINVIIKSDVHGTSEAIKGALEKLKNDEAAVNVIHASAGEISKSDVLLASASSAIIYGFNLRVSESIRQFAKEQKVEIKNYSIIYKIIEELELMLKGLKAPKYEKKFMGEAQILKIFFYSKVGNIAGCVATSGKIKANSRVEIWRKKKLIFDGKLDSLKSGPNEIKEAANGHEFGCHINKFNQIEEGDIIKAYEEVLVED